MFIVMIFNCPVYFSLFPKWEIYKSVGSWCMAHSLSESYVEGSNNPHCKLHIKLCKLHISDCFIWDLLFNELLCI